jgi:hypothetical protein
VFSAISVVIFAGGLFDQTSSRNLFACNRALRVTYDLLAIVFGVADQ